MQELLPVAHVLPRNNYVADDAFDLSAEYAMSKEVVTGLNVLKNGSDPALKNDEELPEWLWKLEGQRKTLAELQRQDDEILSIEDLKYKKRLENRKKIRVTNALKSK